MSVTPLFPPPPSSPVPDLLDHVGLSRTQAPALAYFLEDYCREHRLIAAANTPENRRNLALQLVGAPLKQAFNLLRINHRPFIAFAEDIPDALYAATAALRLDPDITNTVCAKALSQPDGQPLHDTIDIVYDVRRTLYASADDMADAFKAMGGWQQLALMGRAVYIAGGYLDMLNAPDARAQLDAAGSAHARFRPLLDALENTLAGHEAAMAQAFCFRMHDIRRIEAALPASPRVHSNTAKIIVLPAFHKARPTPP